MQETVDTVKRLLAETCAIDAGEIREDGRLVAYGLDSVRVMDFVIAIEDAYDVRIKQADAPGLQTVADVAAYIEQHRQTAQ